MTTEFKYTQDNPLRFKDEAMFALSGTISDLEIAPDRVNLLEKIQGHSKAKNIATAAAASFTDLYGVVANSAMLAMYDGETVYSFACLLDGKPLVGQFEHADQLKNGDKVTVVASQREDVLFVHAIMLDAAQQFLMPLNVYATNKGLQNEGMRFGMQIWLGGFAAYLVFIIFYNIFDDEGLSLENNIIGLVFAFFGTAVAAFISQVGEYFSFKGNGDYAEAIFKVFDFPKPSRIDLLDVGFPNINGPGWKDAFQADKMREALMGKKSRRAEDVAENTE